MPFTLKYDAFVSKGKKKSSSHDVKKKFTFLFIKHNYAYSTHMWTHAFLPPTQHTISVILKFHGKKVIRENKHVIKYSLGSKNEVVLRHTAICLYYFEKSLSHHQWNTMSSWNFTFALWPPASALMSLEGVWSLSEIYRSFNYLTGNRLTFRFYSYQRHSL